MAIVIALVNSAHPVHIRVCSFAACVYRWLWLEPPCPPPVPTPVEESKGNPKALFRLTRNMMGNSGETILPFHTCKINMATDFSAFFYNTILNIRSELGLPGVYKCGYMTNSFLELH